jgi:hypothetical protein
LLSYQQKNVSSDSGSRSGHLDASTTLLPHRAAFMRMKLVYRAGSGTFSLGKRQK